MNKILKQVKDLVNTTSKSCALNQYKMSNELLNLSEKLLELSNEMREKANLTLKREFSEIAASKADSWKESGITIELPTTADYFRITSFFSIKGINFSFHIDHDEEEDDERLMEFSLFFDLFDDSLKTTNSLSSEQMPVYLGLINQFYDKFKEISKDIEMVEHDGDEYPYFCGTIDNGESLASSATTLFDTLSSLITNLNSK